MPENQIKNRPYKFHALPDTFTTRPTIWQDGSDSPGKLSGELRCELTNLTPLLVGWERQKIAANDESWEPAEGEQHAMKRYVEGLVGAIPSNKSVLIPLRAPWGSHPVLLPGDSLKGLLRHELGALLGAPMERVAERSYSYRPNATYPNMKGRFLEPRLARVVEVRTEEVPHVGTVRVPVQLEVLPGNLQRDRDGNIADNRYRFLDNGGEPYRGGIFAGGTVTDRKVHSGIDVSPNRGTAVAVSGDVQAGYLNTLRHLVDPEHGHFTPRHPNVPAGDDTFRQRAVTAARTAFQLGDMVWVEWDTKQRTVVSCGWHYYYRWAYRDTVRRRDWKGERDGLFPLDAERGDIPQELSAVRRLFGYSGDNDGSAGIGVDDHSQLMGRISINTAIEVIEDETDESRFEKPTFLKELGQPRPSAVEFYLKQPYDGKTRPIDDAFLVTYGDAKGYDDPGELAGRKFYLDRPEAHAGRTGGRDALWEDTTDANRDNDRSTLALNASKPHRIFRFTLRFWDLEADELAAILLALCPNQFGPMVVDKPHRAGYCSKLGYARPYGWGSVRVDVKTLSLGQSGQLVRDVVDAHEWFKENFVPLDDSDKWLRLHHVNHGAAEDYPRRDGGEIFNYHTDLRAEHSRLRRYRSGR